MRERHGPVAVGGRQQEPVLVGPEHEVDPLLLRPEHPLAVWPGLRHPAEEERLLAGPLREDPDADGHRVDAVELAGERHLGILERVRELEGPADAPGPVRSLTSGWSRAKSSWRTGSAARQKIENGRQASQDPQGPDAGCARRGSRPGKPTAVGFGSYFTSTAWPSFSVVAAPASTSSPPVQVSHVPPGPAFLTTSVNLPSVRPDWIGSRTALPSRYRKHDHLLGLLDDRVGRQHPGLRHLGRNLGGDVQPGRSRRSLFGRSTSARSVREPGSRASAVRLDRPLEVGVQGRHADGRLLPLFDQGRVRLGHLDRHPDRVQPDDGEQGFRLGPADRLDEVPGVHRPPRHDAGERGLDEAVFEQAPRAGGVGRGDLALGVGGLHVLLGLAELGLGLDRRLLGHDDAGAGLLGGGLGGPELVSVSAPVCGSSDLDRTISATRAASDFHRARLAWARVTPASPPRSAPPPSRPGLGDGHHLLGLLDLGRRLLDQGVLLSALVLQLGDAQLGENGARRG